MDIVNHFYTYEQAVGTQGEVQDLAGGRIPMVTWGATSTTSINNGSQDAYITAQARRLKNLGAPVILRYFHEPEGAYRSTIVGSPPRTSMPVMSKVWKSSVRSRRGTI